MPRRESGTRIPGWTSSAELDDTGREVAERLHTALTEYVSPAAIVTSPLRRCVETVIPLAAAFGLPVQEDERWAPYRAGTDRAFTETRPGVVVCTHGEVIDATARGRRVRKGSVLDHRTQR